MSSQDRNWAWPVDMKPMDKTEKSFWVRLVSAWGYANSPCYRSVDITGIRDLPVGHQWEIYNSLSDPVRREFLTITGVNPGDRKEQERTDTIPGQ